MERLLTADEIAECLRLNGETVLRKARKREIAAIKMGYTSYRFQMTKTSPYFRK